MIDPDTGKQVGSTRFDVPIQDGCRLPSTDPLPIGAAYFDAERRLVYLRFTTYSCIPWIGFTIISYDLASQAELSRRGTEPYLGLAAQGSFYAESWHRFGIGTLWSMHGGKPGPTSTGWSSGGPFQLDTRRNRLYQSSEGSLRVFDPVTLQLTAVAPQPAQGALAAYDRVSDQLYFIDGAAVRPWPVAKLTSPTEAPDKVEGLPAAAVRLIAPSPAWGQDKTVFAGWAQATDDTRCYVFNQTYNSGPLLLSRDGGEQWLRPASGLPADCNLVSAVAVSPAYARDRTILAGVRGNGIFKSTDGGTTWRPVGKGLPHMGVNGLALSHGFAADRTVFAAVYDNGLQRSVDGGETWETLRTGASPLIALSPEFDRDGMLAVFGMAAGGGALQLSADRGNQWRTLTMPSDAAVRLLSLAPAFKRWGVLFAGDLNGDIYRSADRGQSWQRVLRAASETSASPNVEQMQIVYGPNEARREVFLVVSGARFEGEQRVVWGRMYRSADGGQTWAEMTLANSSLPTALAISPSFVQDGLLFVGTADGRILTITPG